LLKLLQLPNRFLIGITISSPKLISDRGRSKEGVLRFVLSPGKLLPNSTTPICLYVEQNSAYISLSFIVSSFLLLSLLLFRCKITGVRGPFDWLMRAGKESF